MTRKRTCCLLVAFTLLIMSPIVSGQDEGNGDEATQTTPTKKNVRRIEVKRYLGVNSDVVLQAISRGVNRNVRFSDTFRRAGRPPKSLRTISYSGQGYRIAAMFQTGSGLYCLVPAKQKDTLSKLRGENRLPEGQQITVEGTTLGVPAGRELVLVDRLITGQNGESSIEHELMLRWPGSQGAEPVLITEAGEHSITFPCRHVPNEKAEVRLIIKKRNREEFLAELEEKTGGDSEEGEEEVEKEKQYRVFDSVAVYRQIRQRNNLDVIFEDRIKGVLSNAPNSVRLPNRRVRVGGGFSTYQGITCIIPAGKEKMLDVVDRLIPGQDVKVWGQTLPPVGEYRPVLVDKIELPGTTQPGQSSTVWDVTLFWGDIESVRFFKIGTYQLTFPCQNRDDTIEGLVADLREVRVIPEE